MFPQMTLDINRAWDNEFDSYPILLTHVETVALLSKLNVDKHINTEIDLDELDLASAENKVTYAQIKEWLRNIY